MQWIAKTAWILPLLFALGCGQARTAPPLEIAATIAEPQSLFDPAKAGTIHGTVSWEGDVPAVPPFEVVAFIPDDAPSRPRLIRPNPHAPIIDGKSKGVADVLVYLRSVDPRQSRPWDHPPVSVEFRDRQLYVLQGDKQVRTGVVHQGEPVTTVSREKKFDILQASGAAFFSLPFPDPDKPLQRVLTEKGIVELAAGADCYWMRGYLFVSEHPYVTRTGELGQFELKQVPPGRYQVVCCLPNWHQKSEDRNPENGGVISRIYFQAPVEMEREVTVEPSGSSPVDFRVSLEMFKSK